MCIRDRFKDQLRRGDLALAPAAEKSTLRVGGRRVAVDASDDWNVLGSEINVLGRWWTNSMSKADRKKAWPCKLVGFSRSYKWPEGDLLPTYFIESQGHLYPMRAADVKQLLPTATREAIDAAAAVEDAQAPPFVLEQVLWLDEFHKKCILGKVSPYDCKMPMKDGKFCRQEDGGTYGAWSDRTTTKFPKEVRFLFGVAMLKDCLLYTSPSPRDS